MNTPFKNNYDSKDSLLYLIDATPWFEIIKWTKELKKEIKHLENNLKIE